VADTAIVGRLGTEPLAGLALAASVLLLVTALCNFLAYGTTPRVARARGAGDEAGAATVGVQALWLAVLMGLPIAAALALLARPLCTLLGGTGGTLDAAVLYLRISAVGIPFVLVALVGQGVFRGVADLRTPLAIVFVANTANLIIEIIAVYGLDLGIAGSAWSTVIVQIVAAGAYLGLLRRRLRPAPSREPRWREIQPLLASGAHLVLRVGSLIAAFGVATAVAARIDTATVAAHQIVNSVFTLLALSLDAFAIPAQTLVAEALGAGDQPLARQVGERVLLLSVVLGVGVAAGLAFAAPLVARIFTSDGAVTSRATGGLIMLAVLLVPGAVAFALDGVLIGAGDVRFLGRVMLVSLLLYLPFVLGVLAVPALGIVGIWGALALWMCLRAGLTDRRFRGSSWLTAAV
jgi:putative MATE family efflux protein